MSLKNRLWGTIILP